MWGSIHQFDVSNVFWQGFYPVAVHYHVEKSPCHVFWHISAVLFSRLDSDSSVIVGNAPTWWFHSNGVGHIAQRHPNSTMSMSSDPRIFGVTLDVDACPEWKYIFFSLGVIVVDPLFHYQWRCYTKRRLIWLATLFDVGSHGIQLPFLLDRSQYFQAYRNGWLGHSCWFRKFLFPLEIPSLYDHGFFKPWRKAENWRVIRRVNLDGQINVDLLCWYRVSFTEDFFLHGK